jgi:hypothetical protein
VPNYGKVTVQFTTAGGIDWSPTDPNSAGYAWATNPQSYYAPLSPNYHSAAIAGVCMDNGDDNWAPMQYTVSQTGENCSLSFQMQGAGR